MTAAGGELDTTTMPPMSSRFLAVSPEIADRLAGRPRAFLDVPDYLRHVRFVAGRVKWWQVPAAIAAFLLIVLATGPVFMGIR